MANGLVSMSTMHYQMAKVKYPTRDENGWHILRTIEEEYVHALLQSCIHLCCGMATYKYTHVKNVESHISGVDFHWVYRLREEKAKPIYEHAD